MEGDHSKNLPVSGSVPESEGAHVTPAKPAQPQKFKFLSPGGIERELDKLDKVGLGHEEEEDSDSSIGDGDPSGGEGLGADSDAAFLGFISTSDDDDDLHKKLSRAEKEQIVEWLRDNVVLYTKKTNRLPQRVAGCSKIQYLTR